jgi:hypothetical protein
VTTKETPRYIPQRHVKDAGRDGTRLFTSIIIMIPLIKRPKGREGSCPACGGRG